MSRRVVSVTTGSRLHFGMFSLGAPGVRQFGGVGVMIDQPGVRLQITESDQLSATGPMSEAALRAARALAQAEISTTEPHCRIEVQSAPPRHAGLGSGTQLALAVAAGIRAIEGGEPLEPEQLARAVGRGQRSAVGLYGFLQGGLIVEAGKLTDDEISPLVARVPVSPDWRFLLVRPQASEGLSGDAERLAFAQLPPAPASVTAEMCREALMELLPAVIERRFDRFSGSLFRFGQQAGSCFASLQAGVYATTEVAEAARLLAELGVVGVAQSSWGPTLFAALPSEQAAHAIVDQLQKVGSKWGGECIIARPLNAGATIDVAEEYRGEKS
jgi:beta-ribofuranosylaminobenzene 5'-phosphate synthase